MESKEPDYKAMWEEVSARIDHDYEPHHFIRYLKNSILAKHTPREKTAEEKLVEVREYAENILSKGSEGNIWAIVTRISDLCK